MTLEALREKVSILGRFYQKCLRIQKLKSRFLHEKIIFFVLDFFLVKDTSFLRRPSTPTILWEHSFKSTLKYNIPSTPFKKYKSREKSRSRRKGSGWRGNRGRGKNMKKKRENKKKRERKNKRKA